MPELPDVEQHRRRFDDDAAGRTVTGVAVPDRDILAGTSPQGLGRSLGGRTLDRAARHGMWPSRPAAGGGPRLLVHFRMTGELVVSDDPADRTDRDAVILRLDGREVRYRTVRRMGVVHWLPAGRSTETVTGPLGVDALALGPGDLAGVLHGRRGASSRRSWTRSSSPAWATSWLTRSCGGPDCIRAAACGDWGPTTWTGSTPASGARCGGRCVPATSRRGRPR